jgi:hypothetical protein
MTIDVEAKGGISVHWRRADAWLLIEGGAASEVWLVWHGKPVRRWAMATC